MELKHHLQRWNQPKFNFNLKKKVIKRESKDTSLCEKVIDSVIAKEDCYFYVARDAKDSGPCEKITDSSMKDRCYTFSAR